MPSDPVPTPSAAAPDRSLKKNSLYRIDLGKESVSCRLKVVDPRPPLKNSALAPYLREVVKCLVKTFEDPLAGQGFELTPPKVKTYRKSISTPCGKYGEGAAPAYYCSATETIYWPEDSDDGDEAYTFARLGYVGLTAHEFGHHLQAVTGMLTNYGIDFYNVAGRPALRLLVVPQRRQALERHRAPRDQPPDPDRRGRGRDADRARRVRRPPGNRPRRRPRR